MQAFVGSVIDSEQPELLVEAEKGHPDDPTLDPLFTIQAQGAGFNQELYLRDVEAVYALAASLVRAANYVRGEESR